MRKLALALIGLLVLQIGVGAVGVFSASNNPMQPSGKSVLQSNPGAIVIDVDDLVQGQGSFEALFSDRVQKELTHRISNSAKGLVRNWTNGSPQIDALVYYRFDGKLLTSEPPKLSSRTTDGPFSIHQPMPPGGIIDWRFTAGDSCQPGAAAPSPYWNCATEITNIQNFVLGGGGGVTVGMEQCIQDVFGSPFFSQKVLFRRDDSLPPGVAGLYQSAVAGTAMIYLPSYMGLQPNDDINTPDLEYAQVHRLGALTHEMVHAFYDQLNMYYHAWSEGMVEMQAKLARRLWCQRNGWNTFHQRVELLQGTPITSPLYENVNQEAIAPGGGFFYVDAAIGTRMGRMAALRYEMAANAWYKVWRETTTGIINDGDLGTWGGGPGGNGTFFREFNGRYFDRWLVYPPGIPGIRGDITLLKQLSSDSLNFLKGNRLVENMDFETGWYGKNHILRTDTSLGGKLYVPNGPSTPAGGLQLLAGDVLPAICDIGTHFRGWAGPGAARIGLDWTPYFYRTLPGGDEVPLAGQATIMATSLHGQGGLTIGQDITNRVGFHDGYTGLPPAAWTDLSTVTLTFDTNGALSVFAGGSGFPPGLYFAWDPPGPPNPLPSGGYQIEMNATTLPPGPSATTSSQTMYFGSQEQTSDGVHSGVMLGGGTNINDQLSFNINGGPWSPIINPNPPPAPGSMGGDAAFSNAFPPSTIFQEGAMIGYQYLGQGAPYADFDYANAGSWYYVHRFTTSYNRLNQTLPSFVGRYGFATLAQSTDYGANEEFRTYYCSFVSDASQGALGNVNLKYRPDYVPPESRLVACYLYANSVGRPDPQNPGLFIHEGIIVNGGRPGINPDNEIRTGQFLGRNNDSNYRPTCACEGWAQMQSTFRFDITDYLGDDPYGFFTITRLFQRFEPGNPQRYGFEVVLIYENDNLPLSQIMIADGALTICNNNRSNSETIFTGFRTPPNIDEWPVDNAGGGAYMAILGNSADNGACNSAAITGRFDTEWDFWAVSTNLVQMDRIWLNPSPADTNAGQGGPWYSPGFIGSTGQNDAPNNIPSWMPGNYYYAPRAMNPLYASTCKQYSCAWFWNRNFTVVAAKTPLMWRVANGVGDWWDYVNRDYDTGALHRPTRSYLAGEDSTITLRPYLVCDNIGLPDPNAIDDGAGPCVATEWGNRCPPHDGTIPAGKRGPGSAVGNRNCLPTGPGGPFPAPYYPRSDERGHMHAFILQVPIVPSLQITKVATPDPVLPDGVILYRITVTNASPYTQTNVRMVENYPIGVTFIDSSPPPDIGETIWTNSIGHNGDGSLDPFEKWSCQIRVRVGHLAKGTRLINNVLTYADTAPNPAFASATTEVLGEPMLSITKTTKKFSIQQGEKVEFKITVQNIGTRESEGVTVIDLMPREFDYVASVPSGSVGLQKIVWSLGRLDPNKSVTITITFKTRTDILLNPGITLINRAMVTSLEGLEAHDSAVVTLREGSTVPVRCDKPDIELFADGARLKNPVTIPAGASVLRIEANDFGSCDNFTATVYLEDNDKPLIFNIDKYDASKLTVLYGEAKLDGLSLPAKVTKITLEDKYGGVHNYEYNK